MKKENGPDIINLSKDQTQSALYKQINAYRAVNTFHHRYKNQSVNAVYTKGRCLFWEINLSKDQTQSALYKQSVRTAL